VLVWRIATATHQGVDGEGARLHGGRWTPRGLPAVYASATLSLSALERFIHTDPDLEPPDLVAIKIDIGADVAIQTLDIDDLPPSWREYPAPEILARTGESWLRKSTTPILSVPSVVIPHERNYVLNPKHDDFAKLIIGRPDAFSFDPRMWKKRA
jgi:RES domain-containing protein